MLHGKRNLVGYSPWGGKESDTTEQQTQHFAKTDEEKIEKVQMISTRNEIKGVRGLLEMLQISER